MPAPKGKTKLNIPDSSSGSLSIPAKRPAPRTMSPASSAFAFVDDDPSEEAQTKGSNDSGSSRNPSVKDGSTERRDRRSGSSHQGKAANSMLKIDDLATAIRDAIRPDDSRYAREVKEFNGEGISEFLDSFNADMEDHRIPEEDRSRIFLQRFVAKDLKSKIRTLIYQIPWDDAQNILRKRFRSHDYNQLEVVMQKLEELNQARPESYMQVHDWLYEHRFLWKKAEPEDWARLRSQSRSIYNAMPDRVVYGVMDTSMTDVVELGKKPYKELWEDCMAFVQRRLARDRFEPSDQTFAHNVIDRSSSYERSEGRKRNQVTQILPRDRTDGKNSERDTIRNTRQVGTDTPQVLIDQMDDLSKKMERLEIYVNRAPQMDEQVISSLIDKAVTKVRREMKLQRYEDRKERIFKTNAVYYPSDESGDTSDGEVAINSNRMRETEVSCWYCGIQGHYPNSNDCHEYQHDNLHDVCTYNPGMGMLVIGSDDLHFSVPAPLVMKFQQRETCVRRLVMFWILMTGPSVVSHLAEVMKARRPVAFTGWEMTGLEQSQIQSVLRNRQVTPFLPTRQGTQRQEEKPNATGKAVATNCIVINDYEHEPFDQVMQRETVLVNAVEHKRQRVDETEDPNPSARAIPVTQSALSLSNETPLVMDGSEDRESSLSLRMNEDIMKKKMNLELRDLLRLMPTVAARLAEEAQTIADGVDSVEYVAQTNNRTTRSNAPRVNAVGFASNGPDFSESYFEEMKAHCGVNVAQIVDQDEPGHRFRTNAIYATEFADQRRMKNLQELPRLHVQIGNYGYSMEALLDTGSEGNIITEKQAQEAGLIVKPYKASSVAFSGDSVDMVGVTETTVQIGKAWIKQRLYVAPPGVSMPFILGMPFVRSAKVTFDHTSPTGDLLIRCRMGKLAVVTPVAGAVAWFHDLEQLDDTSRQPMRMNAVQIEDENSLPEDEQALVNTLGLEDDEKVFFGVGEDTAQSIVDMLILDSL